ncbi:MAG: hypothetical protein ACMUIA_02090 [bacterium]
MGTGDANNDFCDDADIGPDFIEIDIRSELISGYNLKTASSVRIESVRIDYCPADDGTPALASQVLTLGKIIEPGGGKGIEIMIMSQGQKQQLLQALFYEPLCSPEYTEQPIYRYHNKLTFHGREAMSNRKGDFTNCELDPDSICSP